MFGRLIHRYYTGYKASNFARRFKARRYREIVRALSVTPPASVLDIGCGTGADFGRFATQDGFRLHGLDIEKQDHLAHFDFTRGDARSLPFQDKQFDAGVSIGLFEHIQPIEHLCDAAREIARVSRRWCVVVPSIGTMLEPHVVSVLWGMRDRNRKPNPPCALNFLSDEAWLQISAFTGGATRRFWYMPGVQNLMIYGGENRA